MLFGVRLRILTLAMTVTLIWRVARHVVLPANNSRVLLSSRTSLNKPEWHTK